MEKGLESLQVWQAGKSFVVYVYKQVIPNLPAGERELLGKQLKRSCLSIPANIAEAHGRYHYQDAIRFCYIARGSLDETISHLLVASDLGYINQGVLSSCRVKWSEIHRLLNGYINYLGRRKTQELTGL